MEIMIESSLIVSSEQFSTSGVLDRSLYIAVLESFLTIKKDIRCKEPSHIFLTNDFDPFVSSLLALRGPLCPGWLTCWFFYYVSLDMRMHAINFLRHILFALSLLTCDWLTGFRAGVELKLEMLPF